MRLVGLLGCVVSMALAGCGGDDDGDLGGSQSFACDIGAGTASHLCYEFSWNGAVNAADPYKGACEANGAMTVSACPASGKVGGCKWTASSGSVTVTWINWFYFGTPADDMAGCMSAGGLTATWVNP